MQESRDQIKVSTKPNPNQQDGLNERQTKTQEGKPKPQNNLKIQTDNNFFSISQRRNLEQSQSAFGFQQTLSSSTLMHSHPQYSFPKAMRFYKYKSQSQSLENLQIPSTLSPKTTTFGFGKKFIIPKYVIDNAKQVPAPNRYFFLDKDEKNEKKKKIKSQMKGRSFGISYEYYAKTYWPNQSTICVDLAKQNPPVGQYTIQKEIGSDKLKYSMYSKNYSKVENNIPPCNLYKVNLKLVEPNKFSAITFGKGTKYDFTRTNVRTPGPGNYLLPSEFDRFRNKIKYNAYKGLINKFTKESSQEEEQSKQE